MNGLNSKATNFIKFQLIQQVLRIPIQFYLSEIPEMQRHIKETLKYTSLGRFIELVEQLSSSSFKSHPQHYYTLQHSVFSKLPDIVTQDMNKHQFFRLLEAFKHNHFKVSYLKSVMTQLPRQFDQLSKHEKIHMVQTLAHLRVGQQDIYVPFIESLE